MKAEILWEGRLGKERKWGPLFRAVLLSDSPWDSDRIVVEREEKDAMGAAAWRQVGDDADAVRVLVDTVLATNRGAVAPGVPSDEQVTRLAKVAAEALHNTVFTEEWWFEDGWDPHGGMPEAWRVRNEVRPDFERLVRAVLGALVVSGPEHCPTGRKHTAAQLCGRERCDHCGFVGTTSTADLPEEGLEGVSF